MVEELTFGVEPQEGGEIRPGAPIRKLAWTSENLIQGSPIGGVGPTKSHLTVAHGCLGNVNVGDIIQIQQGSNGTIMRARVTKITTDSQLGFDEAVLSDTEISTGTSTQRLKKPKKGKNRVRFDPYLVEK